MISQLHHLQALTSLCNTAFVRNCPALEMGPYYIFLHALLVAFPVSLSQSKFDNLLHGYMAFDRLGCVKEQ